MDSWIGSTAAQIAEAVRRKEAEPRLVVQQHLDRIERLDPQLNAFRRIRHEEALAEADRLADSSDLAQLPLAGVPIAVKDNVPVAGEETRRGSAATSAELNAADHPAVARLRAAGAIVVGLTNVPELALLGMTDSVYGITRNPWDRDRTPGGSSGGSAAAVASAMVPIAHGNDGLGSIRIPSACCGLVGIKPGAGVVPAADVEGDEPPWFGISENGVLSTTVRDAALVLSVMAGVPDLADAAADGVATAAGATGAAAEVGSLRASVDPARPGGLATATRSAEDGVLADSARSAGFAQRVEPLTLGRLGETRALRIGVSVRPIQLGVRIDKRCVAATVRIGELLAGLGYNVSRHKESYPTWLGPGTLLTWFACARLDGRMLDRSLLGRSTRGFVSVANALAAAHLTGARTRSRWHDGTADAFFGDLDVLVLPSLNGPPPPAISYRDRSVVRGVATSIKFTSLFAPWNLAGWPAMNVPVGVHDVGTPLNVQLVARPGGERLLLALAAQLEATRPWPRHAPDYRPGTVLSSVCANDSAA